MTGNNLTAKTITTALTPKQGRDLVNQLLGQTQLAGASEQFFRTVRTSKLAIVKESKLYQQLRGMTTPNGSELSGTWEEFCQILNISVDKADLDIANLQAFGEDAFEAMRSAGIGYRELRQFRKLPEDEKTALIEAAKDGDKDALLDVAEAMIAKHAKEKSQLVDVLAEEKKAMAKERKAFAETEKHKKLIEAQLKEAHVQIEKAYSPATGLHPRTIATREEAAHAQLEAQVGIERLQRIMQEIMGEPSIERDTEHEMRVVSIVLQARAVYARAALLVHEIAALGYDIAQYDTPPEQLLSVGEAHRYLEEHEHLVSVAASKAAGRKMVRETAPDLTSTKRGRPAKK